MSGLPAIRLCLAVIACACVLLPAPPAAAADVYKWVDEQGTFHVTDRLDDVPEPYRSMYVAQAKARQEREANAKGKGKRAPAPSAPGRSGERPQDRPASSDVARPPGAPGAIGRSTAGSGALAKDQAREAHWRAEMQKWRDELAAALQLLASVDERIAEVKQNPLLELTPPKQEELARLQEERQAASARLAAARQKLLVELPAEARRDAVPPRWLEP